MARIAIGGFGQETNSFKPEVVSFDYFLSHRDRAPLVRGDEMYEWLAQGPFPVIHMLADLKDRHELVPLLWCNGGAGGIVSASAFERISGELLGRLSAAMPVDAVILDLHGAMAAENFEDTEGEFLRRLRDVVGEDVPVVVTLDYHANITPEMVENSDALVVFLTYPHVDRPETARRATAILEALLQRGRPKGRAFRKAPFMIPLPSQCTMIEPTRSLVDLSRQLDGELVNLSYAAGFGYTDIHWAGPAVTAHAWTQAEADAAADAMFAALLEAETAFDVPIYTPDEAVAKALDIGRTAAKPVILADVQDNPGGGGTADTTGILKALVEANASDAVVGFLADPEAALQAHAAKEGGQVTLALGGKFGPEGVTPLEATFTVKKLGDGVMRGLGPVAGGNPINLGPMALLAIGGVEVVVASKRMQAHDRAPFEHLGVDLMSRKIIVVKSSVHFRAQFTPMAEEILVVAAPGYVPERMELLDYKHLREGLRLRPMGKAFSSK